MKVVQKLIFVLAMLLGVSGLAQAAPSQSLFKQGTAVTDVTTLSKKEMQETKGAVAPIVAYGLVLGGRIVYVGITRHLSRRVAQHAGKKAFTSVVRLGSSQTRNGARVIEQNNINRYNTIKNGYNRINSISPRSPLARQVRVPYR